MSLYAKFGKLVFPKFHTFSLTNNGFNGNCVSWSCIRTCIYRNVHHNSAEIKILSRTSVNGSNQILKINSASAYLQPVRWGTSFFAKVTAQQLWKGVTSVSNAGRKRGRGKGVGKARAKDLNRGQIIGIGKKNMLWPGLNAPVLQGKELVTQRALPPDPEREAKLSKMRDSMGQFRPLKLSPLERGFSGTKMHGRKVGPPDPIGQDSFEGFETVILEMKTIANMDASIGRRRRFSVIAFTGNQHGLGGFALGKSPEGRSAIKRAKNRAGQKLLYVERYNDHTILHDFFTQFGQTKIFVHKKPEGFGLVCHRVIRVMCELIGIKDIYAKIEGPTNIQHIIKAFMLGLLRQKTHEQIANEKGLYLVEQREENMNLPVVVACPSACRTQSEITREETLNFNHYVMGGIPKQRKHFVPFYHSLPSWENHLKKSLWRRNHNKVGTYLAVNYGKKYKDHLTTKYPECDGSYGYQLRKKRMDEAAAAEN